MKITATTTAATLASLLGTTAVNAVEQRRLELGANHHCVTLKNIDATNIAYVEADGVTATAGAGFQLATAGVFGSQIQINTMNLSDVSVISAAGTSDIRVVIN